MLKRDSILREAEGSLRRLGVDAIDLYQVHWPIPDEDIEEGDQVDPVLAAAGLELTGQDMSERADRAGPDLA